MCQLVGARFNEGKNVGRIETRIVDFPLRESPSFLRIWARSGWTRTSHAYGVYPTAPYPAYPFVRPVPLPGIGHTPSTYDSAANARVLIIYLRDVRRTCRTFAIVRARARARTFVAAFWISHLFRARAIVPGDGVDLFRSRCLLTNRSCNLTDRTCIFIAGEKSHVARHRATTRIAIPFRQTRLKCQWAASRVIWG